MLERLSDTFSARDIMTSVDPLCRADRHDDANLLFAEYDVVPHPRQGAISGFFQRDSAELCQILPKHLVSDSTSLFALPKLLANSRFFFVFADTRVVGYVHYSDLNKPLTKIPFFALYQAVERNLWDAASHRVTEQMLDQIFERAAVTEFISRRAQLARKNSDIGWTAVFTFPQIARIARHLGLTDVTDAEIRLLKNVRNKVAHSARSLVECFDDVGDLARASDVFQSILRGQRSA
jgi:hypothetical protein